MIANDTHSGDALSQELQDSTRSIEDEAKQLMRSIEDLRIAVDRLGQRVESIDVNQVEHIRSAITTVTTAYLSDMRWADKSVEELIYRIRYPAS